MSQYKFSVTGPANEQEHEEQCDEERWAVQAFCEQLGDYLTNAVIQPGKRFSVRHLRHGNEIIHYTVK